MFVPPYQVMSLMLLVLPAAALAQARGWEAERPVRQIELSQVPKPELWVAPGQTTLVLLDAPLDMEVMRSANEVAGVRRAEVAERAVTLLISGGARAGARLEYTLRFADGQPAEGVTLVLRVDSAKAEPAVEVYRGAIPVAALKRQVAALNARVEALLSQEAGLTPLMASGLLRPAGVTSRDVGQRVVVWNAPGLSSEDAWFHVANGRMALEVTLTLAPGMPPWVPGPVHLTEKSTPDPLPVRSMKLLGGAALLPGNTTRLLIEWDTPSEGQGLEYALQVTEQNGERGLGIDRLQQKVAPHRPVSEKEQKP